VSNNWGKIVSAGIGAAISACHAFGTYDKSEVDPNSTLSSLCYGLNNGVGATINRIVSAPYNAYENTKKRNQSHERGMADREIGKIKPQTGLTEAQVEVIKANSNLTHKQIEKIQACIQQRAQEQKDYLEIVKKIEKQPNLLAKISKVLDVSLAAVTTVLTIGAMLALPAAVGAVGAGLGLMAKKYVDNFMEEGNTEEDLKSDLMSSNNYRPSSSSFALLRPSLFDHHGVAFYV